METKRTTVGYKFEYTFCICGAPVVFLARHFLHVFFQPGAGMCEGQANQDQALQLSQMNLAVQFSGLTVHTAFIF